MNELLAANNGQYILTSSTSAYDVSAGRIQVNFTAYLPAKSEKTLFFNFTVEGLTALEDNINMHSIEVAGNALLANLYINKIHYFMDLNRRLDDNLFFIEDTDKFGHLILKV